MKKNLSIGITNSKQMFVEHKHSASVYGSGLVDVYSTPAMIAFMEQTCNELLLDYLEDNEISVGIEVNIKHIKATPIGDTVICKCEIIDIDKNKVNFKVEASDSKGKIGEGTHKRAIISKDNFLKNL